MVTSAKTAVSFVGSLRGNKAAFSSCNGYMKRIVRFKEDKSYSFVLEAELTKGEITVELLDSAKQPIMCLSSNNPRAALALEKNKRYYLVFRFSSATGKYTLSWD